MKLKKIITFFIPKFIVCFIILGIILAPRNAIKAAKEGISIWINILMPSLLPFIIGANLIVSLKIIDILGIIINRFTQKIFNVSGKSGLIFAISMISGYPVGSKFASDLRLENKISRYEGQRLVSFCSTSGPLFVIGSVGTGMLKDPQIGYLMLICHYLAALFVGILFRNYGREKKSPENSNILKDIKNIMQDNSSSEDFFVLFSNSIINGVNTLLTIGGFVIVFSVFFEILNYFKIINFISYSICLLAPFKISPNVINAFISGLFEMTIGCNNLSQINGISYNTLIPLCSFLIAFSGLSILAQCSSFIGKTDIKVNLYIFSKFLHGIFASLLTYIFLKLSKSPEVFNLISDKSMNYSYYDLYVDNFTPILVVIIIIYLFTYLKKLSS